MCSLKVGTIWLNTPTLKSIDRSISTSWSPAPCCSKGARVAQWSYESWHPEPRMTCGSQWRDPTKHGALEEKVETHSSILVRRIPWTIWKAKRYDTGRWYTLPRSEGVQHVTADVQRAITNSSRKNEGAESKQKRCSVVDVSGGESKVWCCKKQYCMGIWNIKSINQGKFDVVKQRWQDWTSTS